MSITLEVRPTTEAALQARATAQGRSVEAVASDLLEGSLSPEEIEAAQRLQERNLFVQRIEEGNREKLFQALDSFRLSPPFDPPLSPEHKIALINMIGIDAGVSLPDEAFDREDLYP